MSLTHKHLLALRRCCGSNMKTFHLENEYGTQRKTLEYECADCGKVRRITHESPLTLRFIVKK